MSNKIPIMIIPTTKGQKKDNINDFLKIPRSFRPTQSPIYTRLMYIIMRYRNAEISAAGIPIAVAKDIMMQSGATIKKIRPIPKLFQKESAMVETIVSVGIGKM